MRSPLLKGSRFGSRRGNAMVEFALVYNQLQMAVRSGTRYGSLRDYQSDGASCVSSVEDSVKNVVVYGSPNPAAGSIPIVRGLSTSNVDVDFAPDAKGVPTIVTVSVSSFTVDGLFAKFTFQGKPWAQVPYGGRYAPNECP